MTPYSFRSKEETPTLPGITPPPVTKVASTRLPNVRDDWAPTRKQSLVLFASCAGVVASLDMPTRRLLAELERRGDSEQMDTRVEVDAAAILQLVNAVATIETARVSKTRSLRSAEMAASQRTLCITDEAPVRSFEPEPLSPPGPEKSKSRSPIE